MMVSVVDRGYTDGSTAHRNKRNTFRVTRPYRWKHHSLEQKFHYMMVYLMNCLIFVFLFHNNPRPYCSTHKTSHSNTADRLTQTQTHHAPYSTQLTTTEYPCSLSDSQSVAKMQKNDANEPSSQLPT